ncbi:MAG: glycoside hydrolase family 3 protein [Acutalibacter sp.]
MKRNGLSQLLALLLTLTFFLAAGCAAGWKQEESRAKSSLGGSSGSSAVEADAVPESVPEPVTQTGEAARVSDLSFELRKPDGSALTVVLTRETQLTGDPLEEGSSVTVTYAGPAKSEGTILALTVEVSAPDMPEAEQSPSPAPSPRPAPATPEEYLASMTLEEKVGQLFFVRVPKEDAAAVAAQYQFGGYLLFGRDFKGLTKEQVQRNIQSYQDSVKIPLLMGVDEEGGTVVRVSANPNLCEEPYWYPRALYDAGGLNLVTAVERDKILTLQGLGINVNFAPVCDIAQQPDAFLYDRSLGREPQETAAYVQQMVELYGEHSMGCVLKHFPGYGENGDTHTEVVVDRRPYETFQQRDFLPFEAGIQAGAGCVLVSHNIVTCQDETYPASLSPEWHRILREELGFEGCIITDDLIMDAIQKYCDASSAAVQAILAGNDFLCCSDYETQYPAVLAAVKSGQISQERIEESVLRILRWKEKLGLLKAE